QFIAFRVYDHISQFAESPSVREAVPSKSEVRICRDLVYSLINRITILRNDSGVVNSVVVIDLDTMEKEPQLPEFTSQASREFFELVYFSMNAFAVAHELAHIIQLQSQKDSTNSGELSKFREELSCDAIAAGIAAQAAARQCVGKYPEGWWQMAGTVGSLFF